MLRQREDRSSGGVRSGADSPPTASLLGADKQHKETAALIHLVNIKHSQRSFCTSSVLLLWVELDDVETAHIRWRSSRLVQQLQDDRAHTKPATGSSEIQDGGAAAEQKEQDNVVTLQYSSKMLTK